MWFTEVDVEKMRQSGPEHLIATLEAMFGCVAIQGIENGLLVRSEEQGELGQLAPRDGISDRCPSLRGNLVSVTSDLLADGSCLGAQLSDLR